MKKTLEQVLCNCYCLPEHSNKVVDVSLIEAQSTAIREYALSEWTPKEKEMPMGSSFMSRKSCMVKSYNEAISEMKRKIRGEV